MREKVKKVKERGRGDRRVLQIRSRRKLGLGDAVGRSRDERQCAWIMPEWLGNFKARKPTLAEFHIDTKHSPNEETINISYCAGCRVVGFANCVYETFKTWFMKTSFCPLLLIWIFNPENNYILSLDLDYSRTSLIVHINVSPYFLFKFFALKPWINWITWNR